VKHSALPRTHNVLPRESLLRAFYFSGKAADQARQDAMTAAGGGKPIAVPKLIGMDSDAVNQALMGLPLVAHLSPAASNRGLESH
jgi:hypothetical protein